MNNDPTDSAMARTDFSLPIISCVWIAAAMVALHFSIWDRGGRLGFGGAPCVSKSNLCLNEWFNFYVKEFKPHTGIFGNQMQLLSKGIGTLLLVLEPVVWSQTAHHMRAHYISIWFVSWVSHDWKNLLWFRFSDKLFIHECLILQQ